MCKSLNLLISCATILFLTIGLNTTLYASTEIDSLPAVFVIGEYEDQYEKLNQYYGTTLVEVNNGRIEMIDYMWQELLMQLEYQALKIQFDLSGVMMWLHIYWNEKGSIDHISYHLKPESRYIDNIELNAFLRYFRRQYSSTIEFDKGFNHYSIAAFPLTYHLGKTK